MEDWGAVLPDQQPVQPRRPRKTWLLIAIAAVVAAAVAVAVIIFSNSGNDKDREAESSIAEQSAGSDESSERLVDDLDVYFSQRGTLLRKIPAASSKDVHTEAEITDGMNARGFSQYPVTAEYLMDGTIYDETPVTAGADTKHPIYTTYYVAASGDIWTLIEVNGTLIANPVSYNFDSGLDVQVVIAETDTIMSYDSYTGLFYETIPDPSALIVKKVTRIDADTLEKLTTEEVGKL